MVYNSQTEVYNIHLYEVNIYRRKVYNSMKNKSTKELVLEILRNSGSRFVSGQEMAETLFVTRASVWKAIRALEKEGCNIEAVTNKGYRLVQGSDMPDKKTIVSSILEDFEVSKFLKDTEVFVYDEVDSTNELAKKYGDANPGKEAIFISDSQTRGKGRRGRSFYSPKGTGMYLSILIRPNVSLSEAMNYTCMIAESTCRAISKVTGLEVGIKWVNDIYFNNKKISGILTEASTSLEDGSLSYVVIGIGINLYEPYEGFPEDIKDKAGALMASRQDPNLKNKLYSAMITEFYKDYKLPNRYPYIEGYREKSILVGSYVKITPNLENEKLTAGYALVTGIDNECHLQVRYDDGREEALFSGEVSVVKY